jgi:hypothetical protein
MFFGRSGKLRSASKWGATDQVLDKLNRWQEERSSIVTTGCLGCCRRKEWTRSRQGEIS